MEENLCAYAEGNSRQAFGECCGGRGSLAGGRPRPLLTADSAPVYSSAGYLVYQRDRILVAQRFFVRRHSTLIMREKRTKGNYGALYGR